jgi:type I restriction enzyme R subunit
VETIFRDDRDPEPRSRRVFACHRPETLAEWIDKQGRGGLGQGDPASTLRGRLRGMAEQHPLITDHLWPAQVEAAVQADLRRAARLRQTILKRAFEGGWWSRILTINRYNHF